MILVIGEALIDLNENRYQPGAFNAIVGGANANVALALARPPPSLASTTYLRVFEFLNAVFFALEALGVHCVGPVTDASLRGLLQVLALDVPLHLVGVLFGFDDLSADAVQLVHRDDRSALALLGVARPHGIDSARVRRRRRLHRTSSSVL